MKLLKNLLAPPVFEEELKTEQAYMLNIIVWALIGVPIPFVIYSLFRTPENMARTLLQAGFGETANIIVLILLRRGYVKAASVFQVVTFWLFFTITAITGSGVRGEAYLLGYVLVIAIAGILLGGRGALVFTTLSLATGLVMVIQESRGRFIPILETSALTTWFVSLVLLPVGAVLQHLAGRKVRNLLERTRSSEERYRLISQVSSDYTFSTTLDANGNMTLNWVAGAFEKITGYTYDEYVANGGWGAHLPTDDLAKDARDMATLRANKPVVTEIRTFTKDGELRWVRVYAHPVWDVDQNRLTGIVGAVQNITEQKMAEKALRESEATYRRAIEVAGAVPYRQTFDENGSIIYDFMGEGIRKITGYGPDEFNDDLWGTLTQERHLLEDLEPYSLDEAIEEVRSGNKPIWKCEHRIITRDGNSRWVFEAAVDLRNEQGRAYGSIGMYQDITERKQAEETLKHERDLLQIFMDNIPDTIYYKDASSRFVRINKAQAQFLKLNAPEEAIGKTDLDFFRSELAEQFMEEEKKTVASNQSIVNRIEFNPAEDGKPRWLSATKVPVTDQSGRVVGIIGMSRDITEQKLAAELNLRRRDTLEKIVRIGKYVTEIQDIKITLQRIWHSVRTDLGFDRLGIYLYDPIANMMNGTYGTNNQGEMIEEGDLHISLADKTIETISFIKAIEKEDGLYITRNYAAEHGISAEHIMKDVKDYAAIAAWAGDKPVAVLCVDNAISNRPIADEDVEALRLFAGYAGLAIANARLNDALQSELIQQRAIDEQEARRRAMLEKVIILGQHVTEVNTLKTTLERIWHGVHDTLEFDRLAIFLYNLERKSMDATLGTNNQGQIVEEWDQWFPISEVAIFNRALEKPEAIYFTRNYTVEHQIDKESDMYGVNEYAAVAAWSGGKPVAVICVDQLISGRLIMDEQLEALRLFAGYAGLAIENARLNDALQAELDQQKQSEMFEHRRRTLLEKVVQLGKRVTESTDLKTILDRIWHGIHDDLDFDRLGIFLYNRERNSMDATVGTDIHGNKENTWGIRLPISNDATFKRLLEEPDGIYFTHNYDIENNIPAGNEMYGVKDFASVAVWAGDKPVAAISVDQLVTKRLISVEQLEALRLFAGYAGLAIENARLHSALEDELDEQKQAEEREVQRRATLEKVVKLGQQVSEVADLPTTLKRIWHGIHDEFEFDRLAIFLYNENTHSVHSTLGTDNSGAIVEDWEYSRPIATNTPTSFSRALEHRNGIFFTDQFAQEFNIPEGHEMYAVKDFAAVTAWGGEKPVAIITVDNFPSKRKFTNDQLEALRLFAGYAGLSIENSRLNSALQNELDRRKEFITELETKNAELERFTYTVSHDLKSPLVTITGFLGFLERDALAGNTEKIASSIKRINNAAHKMQSLLNDLLELSRIGRIINPPEDVSFDEIVNEAVDRVHGRLNEMNAVIEIETHLPIVHGDRIRLVEVIQNLIENAAKYSKPEIQPRIEIGIKEHDQFNITFFIRDNGIGIAPEYHDRIFGLFNKLDPTTEGTGIGLTLVKRIIEVHGGRIWVESESGNGATFYFTLPTKE